MARLKIAFYCQHVLGIGHFHRSLEICRALAEKSDVTLITGGPPVISDFGELQNLQLPGLEMDAEFQQLIPCNQDLSLEQTKEKRKLTLYNFFKIRQPDIFITELYPFGRKGFRFELDPVLKAIKNGALPRCLCCSSVRDILVEKKEGREKFENRVIETLNTYFHLVLVHADEDLIDLGETFPRLGEISIPVQYTGFISKSSKATAAPSHKLVPDLEKENKLIVLSVGGGNVGTEFLQGVLRAFQLLQKTAAGIHLQVFCGHYCPEEIYRELQKYESSEISVERFTPDFPAWLAAADLSISMAGYNTCMDIIKTGVPALLYPFAQNREQRMRAALLAKRARIKVLDTPDLEQNTLARIIDENLNLPRTRPAINIDGAAATSQLLLKFHEEKFAK